MALKQLMLGKKIEQRKSALAVLVEQEAGFTTRSAELEAALDEAETDEEIAVVEENANTLDAEKAEFEEKKSKLEGEITALEGELEQLNSNAPVNTPKPNVGDQARTQNQGGGTMKRYKIFNGMTRESIDAFIKREEVQGFLTRAREFGAQTRSITGAELLIPEVMLDILRENISQYSKLITKVNYKPVKGKARQNVTGTIPEAVWTEMVGALNELELGFNQVEVDGYKVGGFIPVPNSTLQDSDISLAAEILTLLAKAIGIALDKAILYGLGTKQPLGIATRLAQTSKPSDYPSVMPAWEDLHTSNITKVSTTGAALIGSIITAFGACKNDFSTGDKFFAMNSVTFSHLVTTLLSINAAGAIATGMNNQMPILSGDIVVLDFIPDYDIIGGYGDLYLLAEREGTVLAQSEHVKFIEDMTVFKGLARYDGLPVIAKGFFIINVNNATATTAATFATDYANTELGALGVTSVAGTLAGDTLVTVTGAEASGTTLGYKVAGKVANVKSGDASTGYTTFESADDLTAATGKVLTVVEFDAAGRAIKVGSVQVVAKA
jgi:HK97 family phage major capsid protein